MEQLCASSASCGAAALGLAFAQSRPAPRPRVDGAGSAHRRPDLPPALETPLAASRPLPASAPAPRKRWRTEGPDPQARPQSSYSYRRSRSPARDKAESRPHRAEDVSGVKSTELGIVGPESPFAPAADRHWGPPGERPPSRPRSWMQRLSSIATSPDGSLLGSPSSPRPGTPSLLSHGSGAPFLPTAPTPPTHPRNRLVKRSASQRVLQGGNSPGVACAGVQQPPLATPLRRPATSHQREEHRRSQSGTLDRATQTAPRDAGGREPDRRPFDAPGASPAPGTGCRSAWTPFFHYRVVRLGRDAPFRASEPSYPTPAGGDTVRRVLPPPVDTAPTLIRAPALDRPARVRRPSSRHSFGFPRSSSSPLDTRAPPAPGGPASPSPETVRPRTSFSFADFLSYPSPSVRRRRKSGDRIRQGVDHGRPAHPRSVSAPLATGMEKSQGESSPPMERSAHRDHEATDMAAPAAASGDDVSDNFSTPKKLPSRTEDADRSSPSAHFGFGHVLGTRGDEGPHSRAGSRVPSDHGSLGFGSEHSRVFSDGEDGDGRSDTVYDSLRTEATNSSHSGAKSQHVEHLFHGLPRPASEAVNVDDDDVHDHAVPGSWNPGAHETLHEGSEDGLTTPIVRNPRSPESRSGRVTGTPIGPRHLSPGGRAATEYQTVLGGDEDTTTTINHRRDDKLSAQSNVDANVPDVNNGFSISPNAHGRHVYQLADEPLKRSSRTNTATASATTNLHLLPSEPGSPTSVDVVPSRHTTTTQKHTARELTDQGNPAAGVSEDHSSQSSASSSAGHLADQEAEISHGVEGIDPFSVHRRDLSHPNPLSVRDWEAPPDRNRNPPEHLLASPRKLQGVATMQNADDHNTVGNREQMASGSSHHASSDTNDRRVSTQHDEENLADQFHESLSFSPSPSDKGDDLMFRPRKPQHALPSSTADRTGADMPATTFSSPGHGAPGGSRPKTAHAPGGADRGGRAATRAGPEAAPPRSQSVPLSPELPPAPAGLLGAKGASETWDDFFDFDDDAAAPPAPNAHGPSPTAALGARPPTAPRDPPVAAPRPPVAVPRAILAKQASVHGQFGQVTELTRLVAELRALRARADARPGPSLRTGKAAELWREADGIIDLATVDEAEPDPPARPRPPSPAASIDFDAFDDDAPATPGRAAASVGSEPAASSSSSSSSSPAPSPSPAPPPPARPRPESRAPAKHVLASIAKHRAASSPTPSTPPPTSALAAPPAGHPHQNHAPPCWRHHRLFRWWCRREPRPPGRAHEAPLRHHVAAGPGGARGGRRPRPRRRPAPPRGPGRRAGPAGARGGGGRRGPGAARHVSRRGGARDRHAGAGGEARWRGAGGGRDGVKLRGRRGRCRRPAPGDAVPEGVVLDCAIARARREVCRVPLLSTP